MLGSGLRKQLKTRKIANKSKYPKTSSRNKGIEPNFPKTTASSNILKPQSLKSNQENTDLDDFIVSCFEDQLKFKSDETKLQIVQQNEKDLSTKKSNILDEQYTLNYEDVPIPRRPFVIQKISPQSLGSVEELNNVEQQFFYTWRRNLALTAEKNNRVITPYEKNLEVQRQLWRVIERSNIILQIVDSRNPLLYYSSDLERYVEEINDLMKNNEPNYSPKQVLLILNKADLIDEHLRSKQSKYFQSKNIFHIWFSALEQQMSMSIESGSKRELNLKSKNKNIITDNNKNKKEIIEEKINELIHIYSVEELLHKLKELGEKTYFEEKKKQEIVVGMVGYPNVGKSSLINVICGKKRVQVAPTPGRTKHFQTLYIDDEIQVCDCPGLVFPQFVSSRAHLVCNGILPVDQIRDHLKPIELICSQVERRQFEELYSGLRLPLSEENQNANIYLDGRTLLQSLARLYSQFTTGSVPEESRAARVIIKDFVAGRLLYCVKPPQSISEKINENSESEKCLTEQHTKQQNLNTQPSKNDSNVDEFLLSYENHYQYSLDDNKLGNSKKKHRRKVRQMIRNDKRQQRRNKHLINSSSNINISEPSLSSSNNKTTTIGSSDFNGRIDSDYDTVGARGCAHIIGNVHNYIGRA